MVKLCWLVLYVKLLGVGLQENKFLHYKLLSFRNVMQLIEIYLITSKAADNSYP